MFLDGLIVGLVGSLYLYILGIGLTVLWDV